MGRELPQRFTSRRSAFALLAATALVLLGVVILPGCLGSEDPTGPLADPVAVANVTVIDPTLVSSIPDPESHTTCQTTATMRLEANGSHDPAGQPLTFEWLDEVDYFDGSGRRSTSDWGPGGSVLRTTELELPAQLFTVAVHFVTLTVRTRDGREATQTLRVTVTSCEQCGGTP